MWPLRVHSSKRYLVTSAGTPFLIHGDTPWSIAVQLDVGQIATYLNDRQSKGFNAILFNAIEHYFSSQTPPWRNQAGNLPFSPYSDFAAPVTDYWQVVDFIIAEANRRGIVCIVNPAYLGFTGGDQGWTAEIMAESTSDLTNYGVWLANRYANAGVIWCLGGDYSGENHAGLLGKQWSIASGIRSANPAAIITAHGARTQSGFSAWSGFAGFNLNSIYTNGVEYTFATTEYARPGPMPFFLIEGYYDGESASPADCRRQAYASILSGACGHLFGNNPIWGFGEPNANGGRGPSNALSAGLETTATQQMIHVNTLFSEHPWWNLEPKQDSSVVTTALGNGASRICPARSRDGSLVLVWTTGASFSVSMTSLSPASVRARWFDPTNGTYAAVSGSPFSNSGTHGFSAPGERILVLDAA